MVDGGVGGRLGMIVVQQEEKDEERKRAVSEAAFGVLDSGCWNGLRCLLR